MPNPGYVYVLINPSMPGLVKIGMTERDPQDRVAELSVATGVPTPFILVYQLLVDDRINTESVIHALLEERGARIANNREFFRIQPHEAIDLINRLPKARTAAFAPALGGSATSTPPANSTGSPGMSNKDRRELIESLIEKGDNAALGLGNSFRDANEAIKYYKQAAKLNSGEAYQKLGDLHREGISGKPDLSKALDYYKQGADCNYATCFVKMAEVFAELGDNYNADKAWEKFFTSKYVTANNPNRRSQVAMEASTYLDYVSNGRPCPHMAILIEYKADIINWISQLNESSQRYGGSSDMASYYRKKIELAERFIPNSLAEYWAKLGAGSHS